MASATAIDFAPLATPVTESEVQAWRAQARLSAALWASPQPGRVLGLVLLIPFLVIFAVVGFGFAARLGSTGLNGGDALGSVLPLVFTLGIVALVAIGLIRGIGSTGRQWELWARMDRFATANGLTFSPMDLNPAYPGEIFNQGEARFAIDHLRSTTGRFFDLGNYRYTTGSGKNRSTHTWGFLAFNLDRKLPNMVLDSKANNGIFGTNLPATFDKHQILPLEGDFDEFFTLYCPKEYERDALYVFTPDLMALLIDEAAPFDVEIVDDWMFVYSSTAFRTGDANNYARLFRIIDTVGAKTLTQTDRYVDERVGNFAANIVAPQGARLKRGVSASAIILGVGFVALWLWGFLGDAIHTFFGI
ncbi:MAG: hypothetical protein ABI632_08235 [Pseudolysinimonas sp.]